MISVDFDPKAIAHANRNFKAENISCKLADIRAQMPEGIFDNVVWDAAIEHSTEAEIAGIKKRLAAAGDTSCTTTGVAARSEEHSLGQFRPG